MKQHPVTVFMIDVDKFKLINDTYGHMEGDFALKIVAESLKKTAAQLNGFAARYGGDEFCLIIYENETDSESVIAKLRKNLEQTQIEMAPDNEYTVSVSIGSYIFTGSDTDIKYGFEKADEMLYEDKRR